MVRRDCEKEVLALSLMCFRAGVLAVDEWRQQQGVSSPIHRGSYNSMGRVTQFASGVQEAIYSMLSTQGTCRVCPERN